MPMHSLQNNLWGIASSVEITFYGLPKAATIQVIMQRSTGATWIMPMMKLLLPTVSVLKSHYGFQTNLVILVELTYGLPIYI